jgi:DNA-binding NarL/FixJ family response regulator
VTSVRVALVEDSQVFRETLELLLGLRPGIEVVASVGTGKEAIAVCAALRPNVVVMDYRMPGLNGAQATAAVLEASPGSQVVCLTASISRNEREEIFAAGAYACVMKDDDLDEIFAAIQDAAAHASHE